MLRPILLLALVHPAFAASPSANLIRDHYQASPESVPAWIDALPWDRVVAMEAPDDQPADDRLSAMQRELAEKGGGVIAFPAGTYRFANDLVLEDGIILRGADPVDSKDAKEEGYNPPTRLEFPKYVPSMEGEGTPIDTAFRRVRVRDGAKTSGCGVVNVSINRAHIDFAENEETHTAGSRRVVFGCKITNAAAADPHIPNKEYQQAPHQRFTARHQAAINVYADADLFIANNRLPKSGDDNFLVKPYTLVKVHGTGQDFKLGQDKPHEFLTLEEGVMFDYDNRPGIAANMFGIGAFGSGSGNGTPETHPWGFRKGTIIRDNYIYCSGRSAIGFSGDGVYCGHNVIRYPNDVVRPTTTGLVLSDGSATNDNRAMTMRGYRWHADANNYEVHSNKTMGGGKINDGEGIMHENHANSSVVDSKMTANIGNRYLCFWVIAIDGLLIEGNKISANGAAINLHCGARDVKHVKIAGNELSQGGIRVTAAVGEDISITGNRYTGEGTGSITADDLAWVGDNEGFEVKQTPPPKKKR